MKNKKTIPLLLALALLSSCGPTGPGSEGTGSQGGDSSSEPAPGPTLDNVLAHFTFDEDREGDILEETGNVGDIHCSYRGESSETLPSARHVSFREGIRGEAMLFDGYSTYGTKSGYEFAYSGTGFSISCWIAPRTYNYTGANDKNVDTLQGIVSQYFRSGSLSYGYTLGYAREGKLCFAIGTDKGWYELWDDFDPLVQYEWNHVAATFDGTEGTMSLYLNGLSVGTMTLPEGAILQTIQDSDFYIGRNSVTSTDANCMKGVHSGLMDELVLTSDSLSAQEIRSLYQAGLVDGERKELPLEDVYLENSLQDDLERPQFHAGPLEHWMNEPHAPFYYNGLYHLFYQSNPNGPYFNGAQGINWGHMTSPDLVTWTNHKEALQPEKGTVAPDGLWSGGSLIAKDGTPVLLVTAGDYAHPGMVSNQNVGIAFPKDLSDPYLTEWELSDRLAIEQLPGQGRGGEFRDANVYQDGDDYYLVICSGDEGSSRGTALIYHTNANKEDYLYDWEYKGHVFDYLNNDARFGTSWELPCLQPLPDENGNPSGKFIFLISPAPASTADNNVIYWTGSFDKASCRFLPDHPDPKRMDYGRNVFTGPSMMVNEEGEALIFSIMQSQRDASKLASSGWSHNVGLVRSLYYDSARQDLGIRFAGDWGNLAGETIYEMEGATATAVNEALSAFDEDMYRLRLEISSLQEPFELRLRMSDSGEEATILRADPSSRTVSIDTNMNRGNGQTSAAGLSSGEVSSLGFLALDLFVDRSMVEALFNEEKTISARSYPGEKGAGRLEISSSGAMTIDKILIERIAPLPWEVR